MVYVNLKSITQPVGIIRIMAVIITCMCFSLMASVKPDSSPYWGWCMFTWIFCCFFTLLILILEFTTVSTKVPFAWEDFTAAFAILSSVLCLCASIMYPTFFSCSTCYRQIGASVVSWICFALYFAEVVLTRLRPSGQNSGFLSTLPGIMKMLESFFACLIFLSLESGQYSGSPALNWCVAVYSLCFIFTIAIILVTVGNLTIYFPFSFDIVVIVYNVLAAVISSSFNMNDYNGTIMSENTTNGNYSVKTPPPVFYSEVTTVIYTTVFIVGFFGNALVIYIVARYTKMKTVTNMYILNLAMADELYIMGIPFIGTQSVLFYWPFGEFLCKVCMTADGMSQFASTFCLTLMSIDRFLAVVYPIRSAKWRKPWVAKIFSALAWIISFLMVLPVTVFSHVQEYDTCNISWPDPSGVWSAVFILYTSIMGFFGPLVVISLCYLLIIIKVIKYLNLFIVLNW
ncbi:hypothetical protein GOODEAATRI_000423 [Goodea atripinnis]|uniref:G-protein coupled receptors family 1 profile domain-containing protein n=2 Tax=Goodeidae TaxID=28758 RepID=A0ABV0P070_9TELE